MIRRRRLLANIASLSSSQAFSMEAGMPSLRETAAEKGIVFGCEVTWPEVMIDSSYAALIQKHCAIITPGLEAKWAASEPNEGQFSFQNLDFLVKFAAAHRIAVHMHNLVWAVDLPGWTGAAMRQGRGAAIMREHITHLAGRYRGRVDSWDVVNEPIDPRWPSDKNGICTTQWWHSVGESYITTALQETHAADPDAKLLINDDDLEYDTTDHKKKRTAYLRLIEAWLRDGIPLHGFGLEAHLKPWLTFDAQHYRQFLAELAGFGLSIYITELDVCDKEMHPDIDIRDRAVAEIIKHYLDVALDEKAVSTLITWGLSDRYTYMGRNGATRRGDGLPSRPLPFDKALAAKPMFWALVNALRGAPDRGR